jgi:hypothetical protein
MDINILIADIVDDAASSSHDEGPEPEDAGKPEDY